MRVTANLLREFEAIPRLAAAAKTVAYQFVPYALTPS